MKARFESPRTLPAILLIALLARLGAVIAVGDPTLLNEFETITLNMLAGHGFVYFSEDDAGNIVEAHLAEPARTFPSAYMPPAYPVFLYLTTSLFGTDAPGIISIGVIQSVMGVIGCYLIFLIGRRVFGAHAALAASAGAAVFPVMVFMASQVSAINMYVFLFLLTLWFLTRAMESGNPTSAALAGLCFGLTVLARAQFLLFLPVAWLSSRIVNRKHWLKVSLIITLVSGAVLVPWAVRNASQLGFATPLTTSGGHNLWQAQGTQSVGTHASYTLPPRPVPADLARDLAAVPRTDRYEVALDSVYRAHAVKQMRDDPERAVRLALRKFWLYWVHFGGHDIQYPGTSYPLFWLPWLLLLPVFVIGLWRSMRGTPSRLAFLYGYLVGQTVIVMVFFVLPRFRIEVLPVMLLFAGTGIVYLLHRLGKLRPQA